MNIIRVIHIEVTQSRRSADQRRNRIDIFATALYHGMRVAELSDLDLSYTPPLSSPWDPVQMAAHAWEVEQRQSNGMLR